MKCIILAGGFATRLWPLTENKAKPLLHLKDKPIISHIVEGLPENMEIIISTNAVFEDKFKKWAENYPDRPIKIFVEDSFEDEFKKGALGATAMVIGHEKLDEDLLLIAGDNYFGFEMKDFIDSYQNHPLLAAYDIQELDLAKRFGVVIANTDPESSSGGQVVEFQEKPQEPKSTLVSTGCYIFPKTNLNDIVDYAKEKNDDLGGIFEYLLKKDVPINVFSFKEKWFDVGSFEGYLQANRELLNGQVIENGQVEKTGSQFKGGVYLGDHASIQDSTLENTVILKNCKIINCVLRNCIVDEGAELKNIDLSHKMIRQGSKIEK
ncbi:NDP-sugar synthase [Patescibacteria group bacterium]|nr:NDP-sugar synthase [Patescibacteria group bacterium]